MFVFFSLLIKLLNVLKISLFANGKRKLSKVWSFYNQTEDILYVYILYILNILQLELANTTAGEPKVQPPAQFKNGRNLPAQAKGHLFFV